MGSLGHGPPDAHVGRRRKRRVSGALWQTAAHGQSDGLSRAVRRRRSIGADQLAYLPGIPAGGSIEAQHKAQRESLNLSATGLFIQTETPGGSAGHRAPPDRPRRRPAGGGGMLFIAADDEFRLRLDAYLARLRNRV
jgi:hypothetical protein